MATHSSILAWKIPWTVEPGRLQCVGSQRVRHNDYKKKKKNISGPTPDLLDQNLHFQEILGLSAGMLKFKECCSIICSPVSLDYLLKQEC